MRTVRNLVFLPPDSTLFSDVTFLSSKGSSSRNRGEDEEYDTFIDSAIRKKRL